MNLDESHSERDNDLVRLRTSPDVNRRIDSEIEKNIRYYAAQPRDVISQRIEDLEREWDIERTLEANAASLALLGVLFGIAGGRKWLLLSATVLSFLLTHSIQGWCPPVPLFRRAGVRTRSEIDREKFALKHLRGDFDNLGAEASAAAPGRLVEAVER